MRSFKQKSGGGFTIIELLIASAVFTVVITIAIGGFVQIARVFYKGIIITQTQQNLRQITDQVASDIKTAPAAWDPVPVRDNIWYQCIGTSRYTYNIGNRVDSSTEDPQQGNFGLLLDHLPGSNGCGSPYDSATPFNNPTELLNDNMRLNLFSVKTGIDCSVDNIAACSVYQVNIELASGRDQYLTLNTDTNQYECNSTLSSSQFCAVSQVSTTVAGIPKD